MEIKKKSIFIIFITLTMILTLGAVVMAQDGSVTIEQFIPTEIYPNDSVGQNYKAEIINNTEEEIDNLEVKLDLPNGFSFTKSQINELKIVNEDGSEQSIGSNNYDFIKNNSIYTITLKDNGETLPPGSSMLIDYNLFTTDGLNNQAKDLEVLFNYSDQDDNSLTKADTETLDNKILFGELDIDLSLAPQPMHRDGEFTVTATITNEGEGKLFNTNLIPNESAGFSEPTIITGEDSITELESGDSYTFEYTYIVVDNKNFETLELKAENPATEVPDVTESANFRFDPRKPFIKIDPPTDTADIKFDTSDLIEIDVTNTTDGDGPARDIKIKSNIPADYDVINLKDGWSYDSGIFTYDNDDFPSSEDQNYSETLSFKLQTEDPLNQNESGKITLQAEYKDDEGFNYNRPFENFNYDVTEIPNLNIESTASTPANHSDTDRMYLGEKISYTYTVSLNEFDKFNDDKIAVELTNFDDSYLTYLSHDANGIGNFDSGTNIWTLDPSNLDGEKQSITIDFEITDDKEKDKSTVTTEAEVSGKLQLEDTSEIPITDNTFNSFYLQSRYNEVNLGQQTKEITNIPAEGSFDYTQTNNKHRVIYEISYNFEKDSAGTWTGSTITDDMDNGQIYNKTDGFIEYSIDGGSTWEDVPESNIISTVDELKYNLDFLAKDNNFGVDSVEDRTIHFRYKLEVTKNGNFPSWTTLNLNIGNNSFEKFNQVVEVPVSGANADVNIDVQKDGSTANDIDKGEKVDLKIDVSKNPWMIKGLKVRVNPEGFNYGDYSNIDSTDNIKITGFDGYSPDISYDSSNDLIIFDFSGAGKFIDQNSTNTDLKNLGTITLNNMIKDCSDTFIADAEIDYKYGLITDAEEPINKIDQSQDPLIKRDSELIITAVNPVIVTEDTVTWSVEVTNTDIGTAQNAEFIGGLSEIFNYQSSKINGNDANSTLNSNGERVWQMGEISSGESKKLEITANITDADNRDVKGLDNAFNSKVNWYTEIVNNNKYKCGSNERNNFPEFVEPIYSTDLNVKNNLISPDKINICSDGIIEVIINNKGKTKNYNLEVIQNFLNTGIRFDPTKNIEVTDKDGTNIYNNITASEIENSDGSQLSFNQSIISELSSIEQGEKIKISFGIKTNSSFNEENEVKPVIKWNPPSKYALDEKEFSRDGNIYQVPRKRPEINIDLKGRNETIGEQTFVDNPAAMADKDRVLWKFEVKNIGDGKAKNLRINSDFLEGQELYTSEDLNGSPVSYNNNGGYWKISDLADNQTATYYLAYDVPAGSDNPKTVTADVSWGCDNDTNRLSTPDSSDSSELTTKPVIDFSHNAENLTRKDGTITIIMENTGAPIYNLKFDYELSDRYKLQSINSYSSELENNETSDNNDWEDPGTVPVVDESLSNISWYWTDENKPIPAGIYQVEFEVVHNVSELSNSADTIASNIIANYDSSNTNEEDTLEDLNPNHVDLTIDISPKKQLISNLDNPVKWEISITNTGNTKAVNTSVEKQLGNGFNRSAELSYSLADKYKGSSFSYDNSSGTLTWTDIEIPVDETAKITVATKMSADGSHTNTVEADEISTYTDDIESSTDTVSAYTAGFNLTKKLITDPPASDYFSPGEIVEYQIIADLIGDVNYNNLKIIDDLPAGLEVDTSIDSYQTSNPELTFNNNITDDELEWEGTIDGSSNDQIEINYKLRVNKEGSVSRGTLVKNNAEASFDIDFGDGSGNINFSKSDSSLDNKALLSVSKKFDFQEPELSISRESNTTQINAGTNVSHTITILNSSAENVSPAYETKIIEEIPEGFRDNASDIESTVEVKNDGSVLTKNDDYTLYYNPNNNNELIIELLQKVSTVIEPGKDLTITYNSKADDDIPAGNEYTFNASIAKYYSLESSNNNVEEYPYQTINDTKTLNSINSSFSPSAEPGDVSPGDKVKYTLEFDVPAKTTISSFNLSAVLPQGLNYITDSVSGPGNPENISDKNLGEWVPTNSDISGDPESGGQSINFPTDGVSITNNSDSKYEYSLSFEVRVLNTDAIRSDNTLTSNFIYEYNSNQLSGKVVLNVIEPDLHLSKNVENVNEENNYEAGDKLEYTITIDHSGSSTADAYDLKVEDNIPDGLSYIDNSMTTNSDLNIITSTDKSGQTLTWNIDEFKLSDGPVDLTYQVEIDDSVEPSEVLKNAADLRWTSHPDDDNTDQRKGIKDDTLNDYILNTDTDLTINDNISINKTIISEGTNYTIGDTVSYQLDIGLIKGTINGLEVNNLIPAGLKADNFTLKDGDGNVLTKSDYLAEQDLSDNNLVFDEIVNSASDGIAADQLTIEYDAIVENITDNQNGDTKEITTSLSYNDAEGNQQNVTALKTPIGIEEPDLVLNKWFEAGSYEAGDIVDYTITLNHSGSSTATAYDLLVEDIIPTGMTYIDNSMTTEVDSLTITTNNNSQNLSWTIDKLVQSYDSNNKVILNYKVKIDDDVTATTVLNNEAKLNWTSQSGDIEEERTGNGDSQNDYKVIKSVSLTTAPDLTVIDKITNDTTPIVEGTSNIEQSGEIVNITINGIDYATEVDEDGSWSVEITDQLTNGDYIVDASITDNSPGAGTTTAEGTLTVDTKYPSINIDDKVTNDRTPPLTGSSDQPEGSKVDIKVKDKNGDVIFEGEPIVDNNGNWSINTETEGQWTDSSKEFTEGDYEIEASIKDAAGNEAIDTGQLRVYTSTPKIEAELTGAHNSRKPGKETSYTLTISNNGKTEVKDMKVTTPLPAGFELDKDTIKINDSILDKDQFEYNGNNLIIKRNELKDGSVLNIKISGKIKSDGEDVLAGSILSTRSKVDYKDILDNIYQEKSNIAELEILKQHSIDIQPDRYVAGSPNSQAVFAHKVTNKGNTLEKINLSLQGLEDFEVAWYYDSNENDNFDQNDELIISSQRKDIKLTALAPERNSNIFLVTDIKDDVVQGEKRFAIIAESSIENNISDEVNNKLTILDNVPKLNLYDPQNREAVYAGNSYNLKLDYGNLGENVLKNAQLKINLSKNVKDAELLNTSEDYSYDSDNNTIIVNIDDLKPSEERIISVNMTLKNDVPQGTEINTTVDFVQNDIDVIKDNHSIIASNEDPSIIDLSADPETIRGDGQSTSLLTASIKDLMGNFVKDNTEVKFEINNELLGKDNLVKEEGFTTEIENVGDSDLLRAKVNTKNGLAKINLKAPEISSNEILEIPVNVIAENKDTGKVEETIYMVFSPGVLLGRVIDSDTGLPETGKEVRLIQNDKLIETTQTDENGRYSFIIEEDGDYEIHVIDKSEKSERIKTKKYAEAGNNELTLGPRAIEGRLYYQGTNNPIANTQVKLYSPEGNLYGTTKTSDNGQYSFELEDKVVSNSLQSISLQNNNQNNKWLLQSLDGKVKRGVADPKAGDMILDADLPVLADINYGQVLSKKDSEKLEDVKVRLVDSNTGEEVLLPEINGTNQDNPYFTNADGEYLFEDVSPGTYYLTAEKEGYYDYKSEEVALSSKSDINNTINMEQINNNDLKIEKLADVKYGLPEEEITYTIRITNNKERIINELKVTDILPEELLYIADTANLNGNYENGKIIWELTDIQPGVTELKYKVRVDKNADLGKKVVNNVDVNLNGVIIQESHQLQIKPPEIIVTKTSNKDQINIGDFISYQIKVENNTDYDLDSFTLYDKLPPGFKYIESSALQMKGDNKKTKIKSQGERLIKWDLLSLKANENLTIEYTLVVGSGVIIGEKYVNKAYAKTDDILISNIAQKSVQVKTDPVFNTSAILGKVYFDENGNGVQDNGEKGLSKVDIISNTGQIITTDQYGRYHLRLDTSKTNNIGYTVVLKLDKDSLPKNVEIMSDNPAIIKVSNGMIEKVNFRVKNSN